MLNVESERLPIRRGFEQLFKFFSKSTAFIAPAAIAPRLQSRPAAQSLLNTPEPAALATELDELSVFPQEDISSMYARARAGVTENVQPAARYATAVEVQNARVASQSDAKRLDDFRKLFRQTQVAVEQLKADATSIRDDLRELRSVGDHLGHSYTRLGDICRLTEKRSELTVDVLDAIEKRMEPLEVGRDLSTTKNRFASLKRLDEEIVQCGARFETQKEASDRAREEATRVARLMDELQARVAVLTEKSEWLQEAEATVGRLEHRAVETTAQLERRAKATIAELERRLDGFDGRKRAIEQLLVATVTESDKELRRAEETAGRPERRAAALTGGDHAPGQAETAIGRLKRRIVEARVRVGQLVWSKSDVKCELERVRKRLHTLTESARNAVNVLRSAVPSLPTAWKIDIRRPHLRSAAVFTVLVAVNLLGIVMVSLSDQPGRIASNARAARQKSPAPVPLLPSTTSEFAMFDMPAGRASATTSTIAAMKLLSVERDQPRETPAAPANGAAQSRSSREPVLYVGALTVDSEPAGSAVFVDREFVGETPLELTGLRVGSRVVRVEHDGYDRWTTAVSVAADKQTRVSARLQSLREH